MTNEQRQKSLFKNRGMTGINEYCAFCFHVYNCYYKQNQDELMRINQCATAYNRMIRERSGRPATGKE